jgi:hypothetical protein
VLAWEGEAGLLLEIDLATDTVSYTSTAPGARPEGQSNNLLLYAGQTGTAYALRGAGEIVATDIGGGTWSSKQFSRRFTVPALTPAEQILLTEVKGPSLDESLSLYAPASASLQPDLAPVKGDVRDLKVVAV